MTHPLVYLTLSLLILGQAATNGQDDKYCASVFQSFLPCLHFVGNISAMPTKSCCSGVRTLNMEAKRLGNGPKQICQCIEDMTYVMDLHLVATRITDLPQLCNLHLSFPISISMDCSKVV